MVPTEVPITDRLIIKPYEKYWAVSWPWHNTDRFYYKVVTTEVFDKAFSISKDSTIGLEIKLVGPNNTDMLWIDARVIYQKDNSYIEWLQHMYIIKGIVFKNYNHASVFKDWLEKIYMWDLLKL